MSQNPLLGLQELGQSIWIDFIRRGMISSGELQRSIEQDGVSGVTSNPSIFEKAIIKAQLYRTQIVAFRYMFQISVPKRYIFLPM